MFSLSHSFSFFYLAIVVPVAILDGQVPVAKISVLHIVRRGLLVVVRVISPTS